LFQDAVNYYTLALAAMAGDLKPENENAREQAIDGPREKLNSLKDVAKIKKSNFRCEACCQQRKLPAAVEK
jgi:hypothetical protein